MTHSSQRPDKRRERETAIAEREHYCLAPTQYRAAHDLDVVSKALLKRAAATGGVQLGPNGAPAVTRLADLGFMVIRGNVGEITHDGLKALAMYAVTSYGK